MQSACQRRLAKWLGRRPFTVPSGTPLVSFTFDDFPKSALSIAGPILEQAGARGTYYASLGLMRQTTATGEIFEAGDLARLLERGHELGCHTFDHCPAWDTQPRAFEASVLRNAEAVRQLAPRAELRTHSYPINSPRPGSKRRLARRFDCIRGGGQTFNIGTVDLNYLSAFFLEQSRDHPELIRQTIEANRNAGGWLIFATHDVCEQPTRFGCTPALFEQTVRWAAESGARILPVARAWETIRNRNAHR
jgi:peptidoglycan/xylan/chitin deacetylase (PgdA/CDA1 family)